ncbi:ribonuclease H2, subunit B [Gamsiella multidivaricata]|uniref:ribonuclease H2, subunit B n=1 Tax=Gamsiella multidivaricata TaxID=101098 RepID=UPI00221E604C|nr:ribonuclease H2, subunit B [Gamsiella multidivaricata]KAI7816054.1 ribonuclease H2, subunit B [Gamsiella multidivaricata]
MLTANQQRICIGPVVPRNAEDPITVLLPSPSSGHPSRYVIQEGRLYEMQMIDSEGLRSWFIGDTIQSDGSIYIITLLDPIFMFIPILEFARLKTSKSAGRFLALSDIFESDQYTSLRHLSHLINTESYLSSICEVQESRDTMTFRLDDAKVMTWLKRKVQVLEEKFLTIPALVDSIAYTESMSEACRTEAIIQSSLKLVSAYLPDSWATKLADEYQFPELDKLESRTQLPLISDFGKRSGMDMDEDAKPKETKKPKMTVGQRKLAKADKSGMKPLSSFFAKKTT